MFLLVVVAPPEWFLDLFAGKSCLVKKTKLQLSNLQQSMSGYWLTFHCLWAWIERKRETEDMLFMSEIKFLTVIIAALQHTARVLQFLTSQTFKPVTYRNIHACVCVIERENSASVKDWILVLTEICFMNLKSIGGVWFVFSNNNFQFLNNITRIFTHFFTYTYFHTCF